MAGRSITSPDAMGNARTALKETRVHHPVSIGTQPSNKLFLAGIVASALYLFPPGSPQIVHGIFLILAVMVAMQPVRFVGADAWLGLLCLVVLLRSSVDAALYGEPGPLTDVAHTAYPILMFFVTRQLAYRPYNDNAIVAGTMGAIVIAASVLLATGDYTLTGDIERAVGTFNNPNQLAYFAVLATAILALLHFVRRIDVRVLAVGLGVTTFLSVVALSKSGMVAQYVALAVVAKVYLRARLGSIGAFLAMGAGLVLLVFALFSGAFDGLTFMDRLSDFGGQSDDGLAERGYFVAFTDRPIDLLFGVGPGGATAALGHEIHSTLFSFLGKYGLLGFFLFSGFLFDWVRKLLGAFGFWQTLALTIGFLLYGIAHNGSRFAIFWLLVAISYAYAERRLHQRGGDQTAATTVLRHG